MASVSGILCPKTLSGAGGMAVAATPLNAMVNASSGAEALIRARVLVSVCTACALPELRCQPRLQIPLCCLLKGRV
jgi:hypothetical protein